MDNSNVFQYHISLHKSYLKSGYLLPQPEKIHLRKETGRKLSKSQRKTIPKRYVVELKNNSPINNISKSKKYKSNKYIWGIPRNLKIIEKKSLILSAENKTLLKRTTVPQIGVPNIEKDHFWHLLDKNGDLLNMDISSYTDEQEQELNKELWFDWIKQYGKYYISGIYSKFFSLNLKNRLNETIKFANSNTEKLLNNTKTKSNKKK